MRLTADTITDAQIRALRDALLSEHFNSHRPRWPDINRYNESLGLCNLATGSKGTNLVVRAAARTRCVEIFNARGVLRAGSTRERRDGDAHRSGSLAVKGRLRNDDQ